MSKKNLIYYPSQILRTPSEPIKGFNRHDLSKLVANMEETMLKSKGIGLAAPQIGLNIRLIVVATKAGVVPYLNPIIFHSSLKKEVGEEGCLSIPGVFGLVKRHRHIRVSAQTPEGKSTVFKATGLFARVIQHEIDHLNGVLFIDQALTITQGQKILAQYDSTKI